MWIVSGQRARLQKFGENCGVCILIALAVLFLLFIFMCFSSISEDNDKIVEFSTADPYTYNCTDICRKEYQTSLQDGICCTTGNLTICETKQECRLDKLTDLADDKDSLTSNIYVFSALSVVFVILAIHTIKKKRIREKALVPNINSAVVMNSSLKDVITSICLRKKSNELTQEQLEEEKALTQCVLCNQIFDKDNVVVPRCLHRFHERCITQILSSTHVCPICRTLF